MKASDIFTAPSGASGTSGYSAWSGTSGRSGFSAWSGVSGVGTSGYSGVSGRSGWSGISAWSGTSAWSGVSGTSTSGYSGGSAWSGISGWTGTSGRSGYSGFSGGLPVVSAYSSSIALATDVALCDASTAAFTVGFPTAVSNTGREFTVKKTDATINAVMMSGASGTSQTFDGAAAWYLYAQNQAVKVMSDGANWRITSDQ